MTSSFVWVALTVVIAITAMASVRGLRIARSTSDFYVASRGVRRWLNASAIGGEYLAAASMLGIAGLFLGRVETAMWLMIGYTGGFFVLLLFVAAPLRRSNAYTVSDFAHVRYGSLTARRVCTVCVVMVCLVYIVPQLHGAQLVISAVTGMPSWVGPFLLSVVVAGTVLSGGMRSITLAQAPQYWIKVVTLVLPLAVIAILLVGGDPNVGAPEVSPTDLGLRHSIYWRVSLLASVLLGAAGLPHVLVRFCTSPDGRTAQRTATLVMVFVGAFYILPIAYGLLGRHYGIAPTRADTLVLVLPARVAGGTMGELLTAMVAAGAFSALLATSSGLIVTIAGVVSQDLFSSEIRGFRLSAIVATALTLIIALATDSTRLTETVGHAFTLSASTLFPALVLGIWVHAITAEGAVTGMILGATLVVGAGVAYYVFGRPDGTVGDLLAQPTGWTVPIVVTVMMLVSRIRSTGGAPTAGTKRLLEQLHSPDQPRFSDYNAR